MHTYDETETYASLVRTFPDLSGWSLNNLLGHYGDLSGQYREAIQAFPAATRTPEEDGILLKLKEDMAAVFGEVERRTDWQPITLADITIPQLVAIACALNLPVEQVAGIIAAALPERQKDARR